MNAKEILAKTVTPKEVVKFFDDKCDTIALKLQHLANEVATSETPLHPDFATFVCKLGSPEALELYVQNYLVYGQKNYGIGFNPLLPADAFRYLIEQCSFEKYWNALRLYLSQVTIPEEQQRIVYASPHTSLFGAMAEHQEVAVSLQNQLIADFSQPLSGKELATQRLKLRDYIAQRRLCEDAEVAMVKTKSLADITKDYAWKWGFCSRVQSGLLWKLISRIG